MRVLPLAIGDALWTGDASIAASGAHAAARSEQAIPAMIGRSARGLYISGDWTRPHVREALLGEGFVGAGAWAGSGPSEALSIDASAIGALDTLGCLALSDLEDALSQPGRPARLVGLPADKADLYQAVRRNAHTALPDQRGFSLDDFVASVGRSVAALWSDLLGILGMFGLVISATATTVLRPSTWRLNALVNQLDRSAFRAVPIIVLIQFVIGGIIAQQSAWQLRYFGAELFTVDLVAILVLREIGVLISAIMVAGRTGSAFTAEIGAMRMREEVDAMRVIGLDPVHVLVLPRVLGLVIALPILTIIANAAALGGGIFVVWIYSGIEPSVFIGRMHDAIVLETVMVGLIKAPFMAIAIGCIACSEGFRVGGSTESLGERVTAAVVKSIFVVIVMDGIFAMFFASINF